jgi:hypothetical protein
MGFHDGNFARVALARFRHQKPSELSFFPASRGAGTAVPLFSYSMVVLFRSIFAFLSLYVYLSCSINSSSPLNPFPITLSWG